MNFATTAPLGIALLGLVLGMRHATDPDHVVAVTTILSRERRIAVAARIGIVWGLGHTLTLMAVGAAIIVFKIVIPVRLGLAMEFAVAIVLILLGLGATSDLVRRIARRLLGSPLQDLPSVVVHSHAHTHAGLAHAHSHVHHELHGEHEVHGAVRQEIHGAVHHAAPHVHLDSNGYHPRPDPAVPHPSDHEIHFLSRPLQSFAARRPLMRSFGVGLVHGLAGSAAIALLVLSAIPQPLWATMYLVDFSLGVILGMGLITVAIATPFIFASRRLAWLHNGCVTSAGLLSFGFGLFLAYHIGVGNQLFGASPIWTPH